MTWFPHGPDFVFAPRNGNFKRLSRRNEAGRQAYVANITVDQTDPATIYVAARPGSGGTSAFRTRTEGALWTPIADSLQQADPNIDPSCIAINPAHPETIYMGTFSNRGVYVSNNRGDSWGTHNAIPGAVRQLIVDPRTAAVLATTVLYAMTNTGVYRSANGGANWDQVLAGDVWSLVAHMPATGTAHFYAGVYGVGVFHATDPSAAANWTNLNTLGIGLPAHTAGTITEPEGNFDAILLGYCPRSPDRVYVWMAKQSCNAMGGGCNQVTAALYTTSAPLTAWTSVPLTSPPGPSYGFYNFAFAVAPNSPGDGSNDILFFGSVGLFRSVDGGRNWQGDAIGFHADHHAFAFFPESPPAGVTPFTYVGCDGGLGVSSKFAERTSPFTTAPTDFNHDLAYTDSLIYQNFNHGQQSSALYQYNADPAISALGAIGCQDTGVAVASGALGWRGIADADAGAIAVARGTDGVKIWGNIGAFCDWPGFRIWLWTDRGEYGPGVVQVTFGAGGSLLATNSNCVTGLDSRCLVGATARRETTLSAAITTIGVQAATPASMSGIAMGTVLAIGGDPCSDTSREDVTVTAITGTTFTANFTKTHTAGSRVRIEVDHSFVARIGGDGVATQISQEFNPQVVFIVAAAPADANILYCATNDQRAWMTNSGSTASSATVWTEIAGSRPAGLSISDIAIDNAASAYVLLVSSVTTGDDEFGITSPLFLLSGGNWVHQDCTGLPGGGFNFGKLVADPVQPDTLYASHGARIYKLTRAAGVWNWQDISDGLPGQWVYDLWIGNIGDTRTPKVILRASIPTRGVWETDVTAGATETAIALYLRDNFLDQGWLAVSPEGMPDPYNPAAERVWHYQCADIKLDSQNPGTASVAAFYQTDPEGGFNITHVLFDQLKDNSQNLPGGNRARVHVQVHNRSRTPANNVRVWAVYCNASAGVPALSTSPSMGDAFNFWGQFTVTGQIIPGLPADSPWRSVGAPVLLSGIDASTPQVATWDWTVPPLASGDSGHYCMAAFIHSPVSPVNETSNSVDEMTPRNRQVGQKNLHVGPPLPSGAGGGGGGCGGGGMGGVPGGRSSMREYVEFHNPTNQPREATLVFDFRNIPPALSASFQLTRVNTVAPLRNSLTGVRRVHEPGPGGSVGNWLKEFIRWLGWLLQWLGCWVENLGRRLVGRPLKRCRFRPEGALPDFESAIYDISPASVALVRGVRLEPFGFCAALLEIVNQGTLAPGCDYRFEVQQMEKDRVVGGSTYVVCIEGERKQPEQVVVPSHDVKLGHERLEQIEREAEPLKYVPPHAREIVEKREKEQGRKP